MSITDELRDWAKEHLSRSSILAIADRIDAEHERQCAESWMRGHDAWAAIDRGDEMAEHGWIRLPKDADGEYIHVGDVLTDGEYKFTVFALAVFGAGSWSIRNEDGDVWEACDVTHHHEPTVEDVLWDMLDSLDLDPTSHVDKGAVVAGYAQRLQLREDK